MTKRNRLAPMIALACLAVGFATAGAIGGTQIGSSSILKRGEDTLPQASPPEVARNTAREPGKRLPDHYPLVTPEGTIPVAALAAHGRFRGETTYWDEAPDYVAIPDTGSWQYSDAEIERLETWQPQRERPMRIETGVTVIRGNDLDQEPREPEQAAIERADIHEATEAGAASVDAVGAVTIQTN